MGKTKQIPSFEDQNNHHAENKLSDTKVRKLNGNQDAAHEMLCGKKEKT